MTVTVPLVYHVRDGMETNSQEWLAILPFVLQIEQKLRKGKDGRKLLDDVKHIDNREYIVIKVMVQAEFSSRICK